jgi:hypothetical protein
MVKNGRWTLPALFESCEKFVDNAVILDTGSTDGTRRWLREQSIIPTEVIEQPFVNFGKTRTIGMAHARGQADWLLLLDSDMVLRCDKPVEEIKASIDPTAKAYMLQMDQPVTYWNTRLVSGKELWEYKGVTHEYLDRSAGSPKLEGLMVEHHFNHGPQKFERDLRLLSADVSRDPYDARTIFYLAQTLRDMGHTLPAIWYYQLRAAMGGWEEEKFYSLYEAARLAGDPRAMEAAYKFRPSRAETADWLANYYRTQGDNMCTGKWENIRANIPLPPDILFLNTKSYGPRN